MIWICASYSNDIEQQIKTLDKEKGKLEGQRDKERNPFALQQSEKYKELEKRIKELDKLPEILLIPMNQKNMISTVSKNPPVKGIHTLIGGFIIISFYFPYLVR